MQLREIKLLLQKIGKKPDKIIEMHEGFYRRAPSDLSFITYLVGGLKIRQKSQHVS